MAGDEEVEAVARVLDCFANRSRQGNPAALAHWQKVAEVALAAADRVRSRPAGGTAGGTEGEDHEAGTHETLRQGLLRIASGPDDTARKWAHEALTAAARGASPSPVSGTEPDTAKLVEAARAFLTETGICHPLIGQIDADAPAAVRYDETRARLSSLLAGFSVDAGKAEER